MSAEVWARAKPILIEALELPKGDRTIFVERACTGDAELLAEVRTLIDASEHPTALPEPGSAAPALLATPQPGSSMVGQRLGRFRITRLIGVGGMGAVYEAIQDFPSRRVALKVMRAGLMSESAARRFRFEAELLAKLRHPGIAQLYDAATQDTPVGPVPYFAMELIEDARSIGDYAGHRKLGIRERLQLFLAACDAVHFGHQRGVIHRDLKPSNLLVDGAGNLKVIDFGVARSTDADVAMTTLQTGVGQIAGTLPYMSPEQCAADSTDLDVRSDVYALGVVLYELLTGRMPYRVEGRPIDEAVAAIRAEPPERPSKFEPMLRGDLSVILLKALAKDRDQRYGSAAELASDLRRWLSDEPIQAHEPSRLYKLRLFVRRNRPLTAAIAGIALAVIGGLVATSIGFRRAVVQRDRAVAAEARAGRVVDELEQLLRSAVITTPVPIGLSPTLTPLEWSNRATRDVPAGGHTLGEAMLRRYEQLASGGSDDQITRAELRVILASLLATYNPTEEESVRGLHRVQDSFDMALATLPATSERLLRSGLDTAMLALSYGNIERSVTVLRTLADATRRDLGPVDPRTLELERQLSGPLDAWRVGEGQALMKASVERCRAMLGEEHPLTILQESAWLARRSEHEPRDRVLDEVRALASRAEQVTTPERGFLAEKIEEVMRVTLAQEPFDATLLADAERLAGALEERAAAQGLDPMEVRLGRVQLLTQLGRLAEAEAVCRRALAGVEAAQRGRPLMLRKIESRLARLLAWQGKDLDEALATARRATMIDAPQPESVGADEIFPVSTLAEVELARGDALAALDRCNRLLEIDSTMKQASWVIGHVRAVRAGALAALGRHDEAVAEFDRSIAAYDAWGNKALGIRVMALRQAVRHAAAMGDAARAERLRGRLHEATGGVD